MAPEYGATAAMFSIDRQTIDYLRSPGARMNRSARRDLCEGRGPVGRQPGRRPSTSACCSFDLSTVVRNMAGPRTRTGACRPRTWPREASRALGTRTPGRLPDGAVIIAAITSCTNTSNPRNVIAAGLLARNANRAG